MPDIAFTHAVEDVIYRRINARKSWAQYFYSEILEAKKQKLHHKYIACTEYLTRFAYHLIGAADNLPTPFRPIHPITTPPKKTKKAKKEEPQRSMSPVPSKYHSDLDEPISPTTKLRRKM